MQVHTERSPLSVPELRFQDGCQVDFLSLQASDLNQFMCLCLKKLSNLDLSCHCKKNLPLYFFKENANLI